MPTPIFFNPNRSLPDLTERLAALKQGYTPLPVMSLRTFVLPDLFGLLTQLSKPPAPAGGGGAPVAAKVVPGHVDPRGSLTPWLDMSDRAHDEMMDEQARSTVRPEVVNRDGYTFLDFDHDGVYDAGKDAVLVAVDQGTTEYDTEKMLREADLLLERFYANQEYKSDPRWVHYDENDNGSLEGNELKNYHQNNPDRDGNGVNDVDTNGDGRVSDYEWENYVRRQTFDSLDRDGNGELSAAELKQGVGPSTLGNSRRSLQAWVDENQNGKVDAGELFDPGAIPDPELEGRTRDVTISRSGEAVSNLHGKKYDGIADGDVELWFDRNGNGKYDQATGIDKGGWTDWRENDYEEGGRIYRMLTGAMTADDYDYNNNGRVEDWERQVAESEAAHLRYKFDADGNGTITAEELAAQGGRVTVRTKDGWQEVPADMVDELFGGEVKIADIDVSGLARAEKPLVDMDQIEKDVEKLRAAFEVKGFLGFGATDEAAINEVLAGRTNLEIEVLKARYEAKYGESLTGRVKDETSGDYKRMVLGWLDGRNESTVVDQDAARKDAEALKKALDRSWWKGGADENVIIDILTSRSPAQLRAIMDSFGEHERKDLLGWIRKKTDDELEHGLLKTLERASQG